MKTTDPGDAARIELLLAELRLPAIKLVWASLAAQADKEGWPAGRFLAALAEHEIAERSRRRLERHLAEARLPPGKTLDSFDFEAVPVISKAQVMALAAGDACPDGLRRWWLGNAGWREPTSSDRLPSIGASLQPAIPRRVAPQQSPLPLHQSPTIVPQIPVRRGNQIARLNLTAGIQSRSPSSCPSPRGCHLYFARRVTFLSCADIGCRSPIETSPASPIEMSRSSVCLRLIEVAWDDGDHDEPQRADPPTGADRCR